MLARSFVRGSRLVCAGQGTTMGTVVPAASSTLPFWQRREFSHEKRRYRRAHEFGHENHTKREEMAHNKDKHRFNERDTVMQFDVIPVGTSHENTSLSSAVEVCLRAVKHAGLRHEVHAMGVVVEGTLDECFDVAAEAVVGVLKRSPRVVLNIQADIRPGHENRLQKKQKKILTIEAVTPSGH